MLDVGPRRTPGLRREEVAMLAGVSTDYYVRWNRDANTVRRAGARSARCRPSAAAHLYDLVFPLPRRRGTFGRPTQICPNLLG